MFVGPELQRLQLNYLSENADKPAKDLRKYGPGLAVRKSGAWFSGLGEPPPAGEIMTVVRNLADLADRIETGLEAG